MREQGGMTVMSLSSPRTKLPQFDQQQKARGLPTSDELQMQALLEKASLLPGSPFVKHEEGGGVGAGRAERL